MQEFSKIRYFADGVRNSRQELLGAAEPKGITQKINKNNTLMGVIQVRAAMTII